MSSIWLRPVTWARFQTLDLKYRFSLCHSVSAVGFCLFPPCGFTCFNYIFKERETAFSFCTLFQLFCICTCLLEENSSLCMEIIRTISKIIMENCRQIEMQMFEASIKFVFTIGPWAAIK